MKWRYTFYDAKGAFNIVVSDTDPHNFFRQKWVREALAVSQKIIVERES